MRRTFSSAILACLLLAVSAVAQPLVDRLPASTLVYVGWSPNASLQSTATAKMLADERFMGPWRRVIQEFLLEMPDGVDGGDKLSAHLPQLLTDAAQCEGCFALLELKQAKRHFNPQSVLMIDLGAKRKSFEEHFRPLQNRMKERVGDRLKMTKLEKSWVYTKPDREGKPHLTWGFVGDTFVFFTGDDADQFIPRLVKGNVEPSLKASPVFADCVGKVPGESIFTTFLDVKGSLSIVKRLVEREGGNDLDVLVKNWDKLAAEFGIDNIKGVAEKTTIEDRQFVTRSLVRTDGPPRGLLALLARPAVDDAMMRTIPQDAMAALAVRMDPAKTYEQLKQSAINVAGEDAKAAFNQVEQASEFLGIPLKGVLDAVGDQWVVYNANSTGGFALTGWTLVSQVRDNDKFGKTMTTLRQMIAKGLGGGDGKGARVHVLEVDGQRIEYLDANGSFMPFNPAWAVVGDKFVVALYPQLVEDAVKQIKDGSRSILDNPDYVAARKRTGNDGPMVYVNGPELARNLYPIGLLFMSAMNNFGGGPFREANDDDNHAVGADLLPSLQRLTQYLGHDVWAAKATPDGLLKTRTVANPLLSPLAWADSPVIWLALGIPSVGAAEDAADRTRSANNLRQIGQAMSIYSNQHPNNAPPADLATLLKEADIGAGADVAKSPFGPAKDGAPDIVLINYGKNVTSGPNSSEIAVAYDQAALEQGDGTNVLYADGHTDWVPPETFKKLLDDSKKKAAAQPAAPKPDEQPKP
jgi:prepilin-type processing-associated H-X9-DG protein